MESPRTSSAVAAIGTDDATESWLRDHGLAPAEVGIYRARLWDEAWDLVRLTTDQLSRIDAADRPLTFPEATGDGSLVFLRLGAHAVSAGAGPGP